MPGIMPPRGPGRPTTPRSTTRRTATPRDATTEEADWMNSDEVVLWAHDAQVQPGRIYRYQMRIGFFNPIAGHNWFTESQEDLKFQQVLWSPWIAPEGYVRIPKRTIFFPLNAGAPGSPEERNVRVEVYRWQDGDWHRRRFQVTIGIPIGDLYTPKPEKDAESRRPADEEELVPIDFRTGVTILDVIPRTKHFCRMGNAFDDVVTTDIVYRDSNGALKRLGIDKRCWPESLVSTQRDIRKQMREQNVSSAR